MNLILITKTAIIEKIFRLICQKTGINITIQNSLNINENVDFIVVDEEFVNDDFNKLKSYTKKLAAIVSEELPFNKTRDFIINRPFLPNYLEQLLKEQIEFIKDDEKQNKKSNNDFDESEIVSSYVETLADDIADTIEEESDESIVTIASLKTGGILDNNELSKISSMLDEKDSIDIEYEVNESDWKDISEIIDEALSEVKEYEFELEANKFQPIRLILNNYNINELKPFLQKFDQSVIDRLASGEDVDVTLCLKVNK